MYPLLVLAVAFFLTFSDATFDIVFTQKPRLVTPQRDAAFQFSLQNSQVCQECSIACKLDQRPFQDCLHFGMSYGNLTNGQHRFEVAVEGYNLSVSGIYNWTVDSVPPSGSISVTRQFTNAWNTTLHILLSEPCPGNSGFKCLNGANCDVVVQGPANVVPGSLTVVRPNIEYTLLLNLSTTNVTGRVSVALAKGFCTDASGNKFQRSNNSSVIIRFDRNPVFVNLWTGIKELQLLVNGRPRTLQATSVAGDLGIFLDFTEPILNTTEELQSVLNVSAGLLQPTRRKSHGNRRFAFKLTDVPDSAVVTVNMGPGIFSRSGTQVSENSPVTFLYDRTRPQVVLSATSEGLQTTKRLVSIWIRFSKPVFLFDSSDVSISNGNISRFTQVSKTAYYVEIIIARDTTVNVFVPANRTTDIAGNPNLASNRLQVRHYTVPTGAAVSSSFITGGVLATFVASGALSISSTSLAAAGAITTRTAATISSNPSKNLLGMVGHLQIFALTYYSSTVFPVEYSGSVQGLQWLIPHVKLPWKKQETSSAGKIQLQTTPYTLNYYKSRGANTTIYGPSLHSDEYNLYFQSKKSNLHPSSSKNTGWDDFTKSMFWLGIAAGGALVLHSLLVVFLKWRTGAVLKGGLCLPRFELFVLILALPCISQAATFVIRGGSTTGIIVGVFLLGIPCALFISVLIFLFVAVIWGALIQYKEYREEVGNKTCGSWLVSALFGDSNIGKWVRKEGLASNFLPRFGLLFENRRGPPKVVYIDEEYGSKWVDSEGKGIGRMKPINSDEDSVDGAVSKGQKLIGAARVFYILVEIARKVLVGVVFAEQASTSQFSVALGLTTLQLLYLVFFKPFIRRGVQIVETISLVSQMGIFASGLGFLQHDHIGENRKSLGIFMVALLLISFMFQLMNEWFALTEQLLKLSGPNEVSFRGGLKMLAKGLVFPFIPQRKWPRFITPSEQPRTGLHPVVHSSPSPDFQRSKIIPTAGSPVMIEGAMYDPGSPSVVDPRTLQAQQSPRSGPLQMQKPDKQVWNQWTRSASFEGKKARISRSGDSGSNELKTLRELAKASFPGGGGSKRDSDVQTGSEVLNQSSSRNFQQQDILTDEILPMEVMSLDCNAPSLSSH